MHKATIFWLCLATLCGTILFHTSQEVTDGRSSLRKMEREVLREEESLRVLQAEWSYLNQPERLEKLANEYLELQPLNGRQFARISDINERVDEAATQSADSAEPASIEPAAGVAKTATPPAPAKQIAESHPAPKAPVAKPAPATLQPAAVKSTTPAKPTTTRGFDDVLKNLGAN